MDSRLRNGFSEDQLKGVDPVAIWNAVHQVSQKVSVAESNIDRTKTANGVSKDFSAIDTPETSFKDIDTTGYLNDEPRPASAKVNGYQYSQCPTVTDTPSFSAPEDGVMPIAIVGMSCRFPGGSSDIGRFWELVSQGRSAWSSVPQSRFNVDAFYHPNSDRTNSVSLRVQLCLAWWKHS